jgi:hypothetical protein
MDNPVCPNTSALLTLAPVTVEAILQLIKDWNIFGPDWHQPAEGRYLYQRTGTTEVRDDAKVDEQVVNV